MQKKYINKLDEDLLNKISNIENIRIGAYNIRKNGQGVERKVTENINIVTKKDKPGIDIYIKENTKNETVHIPVILTDGKILILGSFPSEISRRNRFYYTNPNNRFWKV